LIEDPTHNWDADEVHQYPTSYRGQKLWPNPHALVTDGSTCVYCCNAFGPEGCFTVGSCGAQFHPPCLIAGMLRKRQCPHCRSPFPPRLYLQFGLLDYMPNQWVFKPTDFPFALADFDGNEVEWSWRYQCSKLQNMRERRAGDWSNSESLVRYVADELYPGRAPDFGLKLFFYQTFGWHLVSDTGQLARGKAIRLVNSMGDYVCDRDPNRDPNAQGDDVGLPEAELDIEYEEGYHASRLECSAVDAILHRAAPEVMAWLGGGQRPRRPPARSPSMRPRTRGTVRLLRERGESSTGNNPARALDFRVGAHRPVIEVDDSDSD
jgi:hypothetical protein